MKRRDFLKFAGLMGMGSALPITPSLRLQAAHDGYTGPLWLTIEATGGWDPTSFCDPKGYAAGMTGDSTSINNYPQAGIISINPDDPMLETGKFNVAPPPDSFLTNGDLFDANLYSAQLFFAKYAKDLLVINGIDTQTNAHSDGRQHNWSGELGRKGFPNFGALVAGTLASGKSLPFLANGGYSNSGGLLTPVRINNSGLAALYEIAYPNRSQNAQSNTSRTYFNQDVLDLIKQTGSARFTSLEANQNLPQIKAAMEKLGLVRGSSAHLTNLATILDPGTNPAKELAFFNSRTNARNLYLQGRIALAAYESGTTCSAHLSIGGFDTHSNHDAGHYPRLMDLLQGIDGILQEAEERNLRDRIVIVVGSDFGRTNKYNGGNGKDHWPITSMMFMGNSTQSIRGNRVIGGTTAEHKALKINPQNLQVDNNNPQSITITPAHIHRALRKLAGVDTSANATGFALKGVDIDLFT